MLIENNRPRILNSKVTVARPIAYYYQIPFDEAVDMPYGDAQVLVRALKHSRTQRYSKWHTTAAIGGKKANKLISLLEQSRQNGRLFGRFVYFPDETKLVNIFNVGDDKL